MIPMNDPRYVYQPRSDAQRRRMSMSHRLRLGIPDGHARVYGKHVPLDVAEKVRRLAANARVESFENAGRYVEQLAANDYEEVRRPMADPAHRPGSAAVIALWLQGDRTAKEIAGETGYSVHTVYDFTRREGVARYRRKPPKGHSKVPLSMCREIVADMLGYKLGEDDGREDFQIGVIVLAALFEEIWPRALSTYTGYGFGKCLKVYNVMVAHRLWWNGHNDSDRYLEGGDEPGLTMGTMRFVLETLLCMGQVSWDRKADTWWKPLPKLGGGD